MYLDPKEKTFIKKVLTAYLSIQGVLTIVGLAIFIYAANGFYKSWKAHNNQFKESMLASVEENKAFTKRFEEHKQGISDLMKERSDAMRERNNKFIEQIDKNMEPHYPKEEKQS